jgi:hypothetical protein
MSLAVADQDDIAERIAESLRLADRLNILRSDRLAVAVGIDPASMITVGRVSELATRSSATIAGGGRLDHIYVEPDESVPRAALDLEAAEVSRPLAQRLIDSTD